MEPALVDAERHLDEARIERHLGERLGEGGADPLHGLAGAAERRGVPGELAGAAVAALQQLGQQLAVQVGLSTAVVVERNVLRPLIPTLGVPVGFAVPDEVEFRPVDRHRDARKEKGPPCGSPRIGQAVGAVFSSSMNMPMMLKPQSTYWIWPVTPEARSERR